MSRDVYEPSEDTALLIRTVLANEPRLASLRALDVGSGSGAVAAAMRKAGAEVLAIDISPLAVAATHAIGVPVIRGDLLAGVRGPFDVVTFNAPYLPSSDEERVEGWLDRAFHGGEGGIEVSEAFVRDLRRVLAPGGRAYLVVSSRAELDRLARSVHASGFRQEMVASQRFFFEEIAVWKLL